MNNKKWSLRLFIAGMFIGLLHPGNGRGDVATSIAFALPFGLFFALVGLVVDYYSNRPNPNTHVKCPDCRELVLRDASKCKHCGCKLIPQ